tara:strand:- start:407 stop:589 length:183 start_codon:yes stop_codon:yes gene_type:complete
MIKLTYVKGEQTFYANPPRIDMMKEANGSGGGSRILIDGSVINVTETPDEIMALIKLATQ